MELLIAILACYGVTEIITASYAAKGFRELFRDVVFEVAPKWLGKHFVRWFTTEDGREEAVLTDEAETVYDGREIKGWDMIACSLCVGFWISGLVALCSWSYPMVLWPLAVYGGSVVLNRQER